MCKKILTILFVFSTLAGIAQQKLHEFGFFGGVGYYMGDVNQRKLFYSPRPAFSFLYKIDFNSRYAFRFNVAFAQLTGNDADSQNGYQVQRNHSFNIALNEFAGMVEFNFLPYKPDSRYEFFSPYVTIGFGATLMPSEENQLPVHMVVPFGIGFKYAVSKRFGIDLEWTYRKTFSDYVDQLPNQIYTTTASSRNKQRNYGNSKDWYSFAGITLTYKFALGKNKCPAYR